MGPRVVRGVARVSFPEHRNVGKRGVVLKVNKPDREVKVHFLHERDKADRWWPINRFALTTTSLLLDAFVEEGHDW